MSGLGLERAPLVGLSYGAGIAIRAMGVVPERISRAALVSPAGLVRGPLPRMLARVVLPMLLYRLRPTDERLLRAAAPLLTEPDSLAVRQLGAVYHHVKLDAGLPRMATPEELAGFDEPVAVFASEDDLFFPAPAVLARAREIFPNLDHSECLGGCRHVPSRAALGSVCARIGTFFAGAETS